jgi:predicted ATPase/DNA-binding XRE family transcriptional regulator
MMDTKASFGPWLRRQRRALDLTQEELAQRVQCSVVTIRKIESDERRPSKQIAEALADCLHISAPQRAEFIAFARGRPYGTPMATSPPLADRILGPTAQRRAMNLPAPLTPLLGREQDIAAARNYLLRDEARLLTLVGPPGIGKTRLSIQLATDLIDTFANGICFVALAPIHDPELVLPTIAHALGIKEPGDQSLSKRLADYLHDKHMLLVLDNFEQVLAAAPLVAEALAASPRLKLLITSRAPIHVRGERQFAVPPLLLPNLTSLPALRELAGYPSLALFVERAQAINPDFALTEANAALVATICARLDGLPLAIELAAARSKLLPPQELLARLDRRLIVLTDGPRDLPPRHVTLRAAIGWSYDLLGAREQTLLARLAVFVGGFTLDAAECVTTLNVTTFEYFNVLEGLASLVNNSLVVQQTQADGSARLTMFETIRQFALEKLLDSGEEAVMHSRHRDWYMTLAEQAEAEWGRPQQEAWLDRLEADYGNLRAALESGKSQVGGLEAGLRLATALWLFWDMRGYLREGCTRLAELLELADESVSARVRVRARTALGYLKFQQGDYNAAASLLEASVAQARALGNKQILAVALDRLGLLILRSHADPARAQAIIEEGLSLGRDIGDPRVVYSSIFYLADLAQAQGQYGQALQLYEESLSLMRRHGDRWHVALALFSLGHLAWLQHDYTRAQASFAESLDLRWQLKDKRGIAFCFEGLAWVATIEGAVERAARLFGAAEALLEAIGAALHPVRHAAHNQTVAMGRAQLSAALFAQAWVEGRMMSAERALAYALGS